MSYPQPVSEQAIRNAGPDPLGVLGSCALVANAMQSVVIDLDAIHLLAQDLADKQAPPPDWDIETHFQGDTEQTIGWIFALDALNFCFWAQGEDPTWRWRITSGGVSYDGYMALAIALRDAARAGIPLWDPSWLAAVDHQIVARLLQPSTGSAPIPLFDERVAHLQELGRAMHQLFPDEQPFTRFVVQANGSAAELVRAVVETFPSFNDVALWKAPGAAAQAIEVPIYKRAQILVSDLSGALEGNHDIRLSDRDQLTAFADYKVPQVMRELGLIRYTDDLAATIRRHHLIPSGSREEIEIRAATIWGCELLRQHLAMCDRTFTAADVDWLLWNLGQSLPETTEPYHRTVTVYY